MAKKGDTELIPTPKPSSRFQLQFRILRNQNARTMISFLASGIAMYPFHCLDPKVYAILTPLSLNPRKRPEGMDMMLAFEKHTIGRGVKDSQFQILDPAISSSHCTIYRKDDKVSVFLKDTSTNGTYVNGTKLNKSSAEVKLRHGDVISLPYPPEHENAFLYVFRDVIKPSTELYSSGGLLRRKACTVVSSVIWEELGVGNKKVKRIRIDASDGPISLDDLQSVQKCNMEPRKLLEEHVATVHCLHNETLAATEKHETDMRDLKESVSKSYLAQFQSLVDKDKELAELIRVSSKQKHEIEDLNEQLSASMHSCVEANRIIRRQQTSISELKTLLNEERERRIEEQEKASADMKMSVQSVQAEAAVELKRVMDGAFKRHKGQQEIINRLETLLNEERSKRIEEREKASADMKKSVQSVQAEAAVELKRVVDEALKREKGQEAIVNKLETLLNDERGQRIEEREKASADMKMSIQRKQAEAAVELKRVVDEDLKRDKGQEEIINKLQEAEKERFDLVETLKTKLEDTRQKLVTSDNKVCQLEVQIREEHLAFLSNKKRIEELEHARKRLSTQIECEKAAREEAWAKVSAWELEIKAAMKGLDFERHRLKAAKERIMICETQLRASCSSVENLTIAFSKQQEQQKSMQSTSVEVGDNVKTSDGVCIDALTSVEQLCRQNCPSVLVISGEDEAGRSVKNVYELDVRTSLPVDQTDERILNIHEEPQPLVTYQRSKFRQKAHELHSASKSLIKIGLSHGNLNDNFKFSGLVTGQEGRRDELPQLTEGRGIEEDGEKQDFGESACRIKEKNMDISTGRVTMSRCCAKVTNQVIRQVDFNGIGIVPTLEGEGIGSERIPEPAPGLVETELFLERESQGQGGNIDGNINMFTDDELIAKDVLENLINLFSVEE